MLPTRDRVDDVKKIAVLRANALGDLIFTLPALDVLRATYPTAEIVLLGTPIHAELLEGRPSPVDRVVVIPPVRGVGRDDQFTGEDASVLAAFFAGMREEQFDLALQLHGGGRNSNPFLQKLGARVTCGLCTPDAEPLDRSLPYIYFQHEVIRLLEVVSLVGACPRWLEPRLTVTPRDLAESHQVVPEGDCPVVTLHPSAGDPRRRWPPEKFAAVGDALARAGAQVVVTAAGLERPVVDQVIARMAEPVTDACGNLTLGGLVGLLSRSAVVVSNDSGPLHVAAAVGAPTVGIFWLINLINAAPFTRARHRVFLGHCTHCPVCRWSTITDRCDHAVSHVANVEIEEVVAAAMELVPRFSSTLVGLAPVPAYSP